MKIKKEIIILYLFLTVSTIVILFASKDYFWWFMGECVDPVVQILGCVEEIGIETHESQIVIINNMIFFECPNPGISSRQWGIILGKVSSTAINDSTPGIVHMIRGYDDLELIVVNSHFDSTFYKKVATIDKSTGEINIIKKE